MLRFNVNGQTVSFEGDPDTPLLWVLRDTLGLTGTKYGCGIGQCGACSVLVDGRLVRSCTLTAGSAPGRSITTIEGLAGETDRLHPVQTAWLEHDVAQCGYCQAGQIMATVDLLGRNPVPSDDDIAREMTNICRCGTYVRMRRAIHRAAELMREKA